MKTLKKLELSKKTVKRLSNSAMASFKGGDLSSSPGSPLYTKIGGQCLGTPPPMSGKITCR